MLKGYSFFNISEIILPYLRHTVKIWHKKQKTVDISSKKRYNKEWQENIFR